MDLVELLKSAQSAVEEAGLPPELRATGFAKALEVLTSQTPPTREGHGGEEVSGAERKLLKRLKVPGELLEHVFAMKDDGLEIVVDPAKVPGAAAQATRDFALLVTAGRIGAGYDTDSVSTAFIREACEEYGRYDAPNFAKHVKSTSGLKVTGKEVKVLASGWTEAAAVVRRYAGAEG